MSIRFTKKDLKAIAAVLADAEEHVREHAAQHDYRADAMKSVREKLLSDHHKFKAEHARMTAARLAEVRRFIDSAAELSVESSTIPRLPKAAGSRTA